MRFGSLFAGVGGFDPGLERAGFTPAWSVEKDAQARAVLRRHWPDVPQYEDVHDVKAVCEVCGYTSTSGLPSQGGHEGRPTGVVQAMPAGLRPGQPESGHTENGDAGTTEKVEPESALLDDATTGVRDERAAEGCLRDLRDHAKAVGSGSLPRDREGSGTALPPLQHQASDDRGPRVCGCGATILVDPVDVVVGGWPCQDLSVAGKRAGLIEGKRSSLFFEAMRIIKELRDAGVGPTFAVFENVPGLLSSNGGNDFAVVLAELANVGALDIAWRVLDSQWLGVAQRRRRVFIVADFGGERASEVLALSEGLFGHPAPSREAGEEVAGSIENGSAGSKRGRRNDLDNHGAYPLAQSLAIRGRDGTPQVELGADGLANAPLTPSGGRAGGGCGAVLAHTLRAEGFDASEDGTGRGTPIVAQAFDWQSGGDARGLELRGHASALHVGQTRAVMFSDPRRHDERHRGELLAFKAGQSEAAGGAFVTQVPAITTAVPRRLTPTECERLQGFPDGWTEWGIDEDGNRKDMADGPRYRMMGNAVTVNVIEWLGRRIMDTTGHGPGGER